MIELTAIIPVHKMAGRLNPLKVWVSNALKAGISIVLIHDLGDEETEVELRGFESKINSDRLILISGAFNGPGAARNEGIHQLKTSFFCFWDSDDLPDVVNFLEMVNLGMDEKLEMVIGEYSSKSGDRISEHKFGKNSLRNLSKIALNPGIWRMIFSTKSFQGYKFQNLKLAEDQLYLAEIGFPDVRYKIFPKVVYQYEVGVEGSLTSLKNNLSDLAKSLKALNQLFSKSRTRIRGNFLLILMLRQTLTLLKNRQWSSFAVGIFLTLKCLIRNLPSKISVGRE